MPRFFSPPLRIAARSYELSARPSPLTALGPLIPILADRIPVQT